MINTIVTDMECNIRIDILPLGRGTDHDPWAVVRITTLGQSLYPDIALHISNYYINIANEGPHIGVEGNYLDKIRNGD